MNQFVLCLDGLKNSSDQELDRLVAIIGNTCALSPADVRKILKSGEGILATSSSKAELENQLTTLQGEGLAVKILDESAALADAASKLVADLGSIEFDTDELSQAALTDNLVSVPEIKPIEFEFDSLESAINSQVSPTPPVEEKLRDVHQVNAAEDELDFNILFDEDDDSNQTSTLNLQSTSDSSLANPDTTFDFSEALDSVKDDGLQDQETGLDMEAEHQDQQELASNQAISFSDDISLDEDEGHTVESVSSS
ncbi:MAG: hypothetical protein KC463_08125, partial [Streptococcus sp.]|nr:hypothetical protein [Streptococcus sp.]